MYTDSHCHLFKEYYNDITKVIERAKENSVTKFITCGCNYSSDLETIDICNNIHNVYGAIGIHPTEISQVLKTVKLIKKHISDKKIIAIGEIGLDYHYKNTNKLKQKIIFKIMLHLAQKYHKPVIIHSRDADQDTYKILKKYQLSGVIHSFSGNFNMAQKYIRLGYLIGINGTVTFKNSHLIEVIKQLPIDKILLETDSPYLAPEPFRGKKNEPKNILEIANFLSESLKLKQDFFAQKLAENLQEIFDI